MEGKKPNFEVGSSSQLKLSFAKKSASSGQIEEKTSICAGSVWTPDIVEQRA